MRQIPTSKPDICSAVKEIPFFEGSALQPFHNSPPRYAILSSPNQHQAAPFLIWVLCSKLNIKVKVKVKVTLEQAMKAQRYSSTLSLTSPLVGGWVVNATLPAALPPGGWVGLRSGLSR